MSNTTIKELQLNEAVQLTRKKMAPRGNVFRKLISSFLFLSGLSSWFHPHSRAASGHLIQLGNDGGDDFPLVVYQCRRVMIRL